MNLAGIARRGVEELTAVTGLACATVIGLERDEGGWRLAVELVEQESIPRGMDVLGIYRARLDGEGHLEGFERVGLRRRGDTPATGGMNP